jgi:hypothetical protein
VFTPLISAMQNKLQSPAAPETLNETVFEPAAHSGQMNATVSIPVPSLAMLATCIQFAFGFSKSVTVIVLPGAAQPIATKQFPPMLLRANACVAAV